MDAEIMKWVVMIVVGAVAGTLAARIMKGDSFGLFVNAVLGIAGAIVGGFIFNLLGITAGSGIVKVVEQQFDVVLPQNIVGMMISATVGSIIILWVSRMLGLGRGRGRSRYE